MTEITRSIEILASRNRVWSHIQPQNWKKIFNFVKEVDGYPAEKAGVGTKVKVVAGANGENQVKYHVEILEVVEKEKIVYRRYGGPLTGTGIIQIKSLHTGTLLRRTSHYDDDLSEEILRTLGGGMEKDNLRLKQMIEKIGN